MHLTCACNQGGTAKGYIFRQTRPTPNDTHASPSAWSCAVSDDTFVLCDRVSDVVLLNPYPITAADAPADKPEQEFAFYGKGNHKNYMVCNGSCLLKCAACACKCHYARVAPAEEEPTMDYRPPAVRVPSCIPCFSCILWLFRIREGARATN